MGMICVRKFLLAYDRGEETLEELADRFLVSVGWGKKISAQRNRTGQAERVPHQPGRKWRADAEVQRQVMGWLASKPDLTLAQLQAKLHSEAGIFAQPGPHLASAEEIGPAAEKKSLHAVERDTEANRERREQFAGAHPFDHHRNTHNCRKYRRTVTFPWTAVAVNH